MLKRRNTNRSREVQKLPILHQTIKRRKRVWLIVWNNTEGTLGWYLRHLSSLNQEVPRWKKLSQGQLYSKADPDRQRQMLNM